MKYKHLLIISLLAAAMPASHSEDKPAATPAATTQAKDVTAKDVAKLLAEKKSPAPTVLDVRTPDEFKSGHIAGAKNIDFIDNGFETEAKKLDKTAPYIVHCQAGGRSAKAMEKLKALGFTNLIHMKDGFKAWVANGSAVEK